MVSVRFHKAKGLDRMNRLLLIGVISLLSAASTPCAMAATLYWGPPKEKMPITVVYGELEVLASSSMIYFCGLDWPGDGANVGHNAQMKVSGGSAYCGIQEHNNKQRNVIFTVWDTAPSLLAACLQADASTVHFHSAAKDFEGGNTHTDRPCQWKEGEVFRFALSKLPAKKGGTITTFYFYDPVGKKWLLEASILNPPDDRGTGRFFNVGSAFLENFGRKNYETPKLCLYRLWVGSKAQELGFVREAAAAPDDLSKTEHCGILNGSFFLAQGNESAVNELLEKYRTAVDSVTIARPDARRLGPIPDRPLLPEIIAQLTALPRPAEATEELSENGKMQ
jgi:hypothetical protein